MARHRQPREVAELKGLVKKNPQYYADDVPKNATPIGEPPEHLDEVEAACWRDILSRCVPGVMTESESLMVEIAACTLAEYRENKRDCPVNKVNMLIGLFARFGMSPSDRQKLGVEKDKKKENPFLRTIE